MNVLHWLEWQARKAWHRVRAAAGRTYLSAKSGKPTKRRGMLEADGEERLFTLPLNESGGVDYTLEEIRAMTTRCGRCGQPIFIGDDVVLYEPRGTDPLPIVACDRITCCDTIADIQGRWEPDEQRFGAGAVRRFPSLIEVMLAGNADFGILELQPDGRTVRVHNKGG